MLRLQLAIKRTIDILGSIVLLPLVFVCCAPAVLAVKRYYPGRPVFVTQARSGKGGKEILIFKLRTLPVGLAPGSVGLNRLPRIIVLIQRIGLDELPQLLNVLFGSMSFVGNRPLLSEEATIRYGTARALTESMRPGIISLFGLDHHRKSTPGEMLETYTYDPDATGMAVEYCQNWTIAKDLQVLFEAFRLVITLARSQLEARAHK